MTSLGFLCLLTIAPTKAKLLLDNGDSRSALHSSPLFTGRNGTGGRAPEEAPGRSPGGFGARVRELWGKASETFRSLFGSRGSESRPETVAFITGSYGDNYPVGKAFNFLETLGRIGGFNGSAYLLTDHPEVVADLSRCSDSHRVCPWYRDPAIVGALKVKIVKINSTRDGVGFPFAGGGGGYLKSMAFDLPEITEDILIWHDSDTVVARKDCVPEMLRTPLAFNETAQIFIGNDARGKDGKPGACFCGKSEKPAGSRDGCCGDHIHVGGLAMHRRYSRKIVSAWSDEQQKNPERLDRGTFYEAWHQDFANTHVRKLPEAYDDHLWQNQDSLCFNHITRARCGAHYRAVPGFIASLQLKNPLAASTSYCSRAPAQP